MATEQHAVAEPTRPAPPTPSAKVGVLSALDSVVAVLTIAQNENRALQALFATGTPAWHQCETVDDRLHDALTLLGD